jgi:hypothetical protein
LAQALRIKGVLPASHSLLFRVPPRVFLTLLVATLTFAALGLAMSTGAREGGRRFAVVTTRF